MSRSYLFILFLLTFVLLGCGTFELDGSVLDPSSATATAEAAISTPQAIPEPTNSSLTATPTVDLAPVEPTNTVMGLAPSPTVMPQPTNTLVAATATVTVVPVASVASISGHLWHDICAIAGGEGGEPVVPSANCVTTDTDWYRANGIFEAGEPGIEGIEVSLAEGACANRHDSDDAVLTTTTSHDGGFFFGELEPGTYCVFIDTGLEGNLLILLPGEWTFPVTVDQDTLPVPSHTITIAPSEGKSDVQFGWDHQFLPIAEPVEAVPSGVRVTITSFIRQIHQLEPSAIFQSEPISTGDVLVDGIDALLIPAALSIHSADGPRVVSDLSRCTTITVTGERDGNNLRAEEVTIEPVDHIPVDQYPIFKVINPTTVHDYPAGDATIMMALSPGTDLSAYGRCEAWLAVITPDGQPGWLNSEDLSLSTEKLKQLPVLPAGPKRVANMISIDGIVQRRAKNVIFIEPVNDFTMIALQPDTKILGTDDQQPNADLIQPGMRIEAEGKASLNESGMLEALYIRIISTPAEDHCATVISIAPEDVGAQPIIEVLKSALMDIENLSPEEIANVEIQWIRQAGEWILLEAQFDRRFELAIFALRMINDDYFYEGGAWDGMGSDEAQVRAAIASNVPGISPQLTNCIDVSHWVN